MEYAGFLAGIACISFGVFLAVTICNRTDTFENTLLVLLIGYGILEIVVVFLAANGLLGIGTFDVLFLMFYLSLTVLLGLVITLLIRFVLGKKVFCELAFVVVAIGFVLIATSALFAASAAA